MDDPAKKKPAKFGAVLGHAPGGVPAYSSDYATVDDRELPDRQSYRHMVDGIYMGFKWQCVEFARRWLYLNKGLVFDDVPMAYDIFRLRTIRVVETGELLPLYSFRNGSMRHPEPGCLLIWEEGGEFETTGHVAVVIEATPHYVRLAEQNVDNQIWADGRTYSREIRAEVSERGEYWLECSFGDATILGWVMQTDDSTHAEIFEAPDMRLFNLQAKELPHRADPARAWLNIANGDEAAYVAMMGGHKLSSRLADAFKYYAISDAALAELERATNELHALYMHATEYVLRDDARLEPFNIPKCLWPKIHQSWNNRRNQMITGRFDFSISERGLKVYEYNCDSASCHMETGKVQGKWAAYFGCHEGEDAGKHLHRRLRDAWRRSDVNSVLHIMQDRDLEETYHALFMAEAMELAGIKTKIIRGVSGLSWDSDGNILDADGVPIRWVWKTWAWETALDQIRAECNDDEELLSTYRAGARHDGPPRLVDVLLRKDVMVYEPLWTLIPSNKAISPIMWELFRDQRYLLESSYEITESLQAKGFVAKPIVGRGGANISIFDRHERLIDETSGKFESRDQIYQEMFALPNVGGYNVQVSTFSAAGRYAGACVRTDESLIIKKDSDTMALRIIDDDDHLMGAND